MKNSLLLLLLLFTLQWSVAQTDPTARFAQELAAKSQTIDRIDCRFEQVRVMQILQNEVRRAGAFCYVRPDQIHLDFEGGDFIRMSEASFTMRTAGVEQQVRIQSNPMLRELKRILSACMTGDVASLTGGFTMELSEQPTHYEVTLHPRKGRMAARMGAIRMRFERTTMTLEELRMEEPSGDYTAYRFYDKQLNR